MDRRPRIRSPRTWSVRTRTSVGATAVVAVCLVLAGCALLFLLYGTLRSSSIQAADVRSRQIVEQWETRTVDELDRTMWSSDGQVGIVQVLDRHGRVVAASAGDDRVAPLGSPIVTGDRTPPTDVEIDGDIDFWVIGRGVTGPDGDVTVYVGADREPIERVIEVVTLLLALAGPIALAIVAWGTHRIVAGALAPVERIRRHVASITGHDPVDPVPEPATHDEVARLARTMNDMLVRLADSRRRQREFVADASHELRSPLTTLTVGLELARRDPATLDAESLDTTLLPEARRMRALLDDMLMLARDDETAGPDVSEDVDLDEIVYAERSRARAVGDEGERHITVDTAVVPVRTTGDPLALRRVVRNLVDNALRHARSEVRMTLAHEGDRAVLTVDDDGPGITPADRSRVFDRFVRLDSPRSRATGGSGLGLAIVHRVVTAHGGSVTVDESPWGGARFEVRLPAQDEPDTDPDAYDPSDDPGDPDGSTMR